MAFLIRWMTTSTCGDRWVSRRLRRRRACYVRASRQRCRGG
jgi:hypothetical protein